MKIICTKEEKVMLVEAIANSITCLLQGKECKNDVCARMTTCHECAEKNIEWVIEDGDME